MAIRHLRLVALSGLVAALAGCGEDRSAPERPQGEAADARFSLSSPAFASGGAIPARFTCAGQRSAPPLSWSRPPAGTRELVLVTDDLDAPRGTFVHWIVLGLSPTSRGLPAGAKPATLRSGRASSGRVGYEPPCPPRGDRAHRYAFTLYALRAPLGAEFGAPASRVRAALARARPLAQARLVGRFARP
jgi:Raf kinase inhibitor-like YbhB/YbcL family protein